MNADSFAVTLDGARVWPAIWRTRCPHCDQLIAWQANADSLAIVKCPGCHRQFPARDGQVVDPGPCEFACGYAEPYGFVPEAGCPVHDLQGEPW